VVRGDAKAANRLSVFWRCIPDIGAPPIAWVARRQGSHNAIASHLGDDGRGGDREAEGIACDDRFHSAIEFGGDVAVDERYVGANTKAGHSSRHRQQGRTKDVDPVDFGDA